ncbi:hypothetical protein [Flavobacterium sp. XGLA_31]|uniref:hypothetical protein n=1 Tax=Flavobacterium sp. XGLA_31 TaxID=3447666 RepID=UPI003F2CB1B9
MKKIVFLLCVALLSVNGFSQKKKSSAKKAPAATAGYAKVDNLVADVKAGNFQIIIKEKGKPDDAVIIKAADSKFTPLNCKLIPFTTAGIKLCLLSWTEKSQNKTDLKTEDIEANYTVVYELTTKKQVFTNTQTINHITEKVFLDKLKNASETQEKIRREGYECVLNPDGSLTLKNKTTQNSLVYDTTKMEFVNKKK